MKRALLIGLIACAALLAVSAVFYRRDIARERARITRGSAIAETPCGPVEYASLGQGPAVLAVHGAGGGWDQGMDLAGWLAAKGFRVVSVSRFGYLRTPMPHDASAAAQADAHACLLDALGISRAAVIGASAGGPSALQFAIRHPDRAAALVLLVPAVYVPRPGGAPSIRSPFGVTALFDTALRSDYLFWILTRIFRPLAIRSILATPHEVVARASAPEKKRIDMMLRHILPVTPRRQGLVNDAAVVAGLTRYDLEAITAPTLVFSTEDDGYRTYEPARYTANHIRNARFIGYPTGGHLLVGHEDYVESEIAKFVSARFPFHDRVSEDSGAASAGEPAWRNGRGSRWDAPPGAAWGEPSRFPDCSPPRASRADASSWGGDPSEPRAEPGAARRFRASEKRAADSARRPAARTRAAAGNNCPSTDRPRTSRSEDSDTPRRLRSVSDRFRTDSRDSPRKSTLDPAAE